VVARQTRDEASESLIFADDETSGAKPN